LIFLALALVCDWEFSSSASFFLDLVFFLGCVCDWDSSSLATAVRLRTPLALPFAAGGSGHQRRSQPLHVQIFRSNLEALKSPEISTDEEHEASINQEQELEDSSSKDEKILIWNLTHLEYH
jgi:hypothetical protein